MCGITGIFDLAKRRDLDRSVLRRMNDSQQHRGPDGHGEHHEPGVGLGHRRLSIIDVAMGQQPLYNEDRSVVVVFNGEIYNYRELITELTEPVTSSRHAAIPRSSFTPGKPGASAASTSLPRHVRLRLCRPRRADAVPRARPARREAAVLRALLRRHLGIWVRAQVDARASRRSGGDRSVRDRGVFRTRLRARAAHDLHERRKMPPGPPRCS